MNCNFFISFLIFLSNGINISDIKPSNFILFEKMKYFDKKKKKKWKKNITDTKYANYYFSAVYILFNSYNFK